MKKYHDYPLGRRYRSNSLFGLTAALLGIVLSLASTPAAALLLNCNVSATGVAFGNYNPTNGVPTDATGNVHIQCTALLLTLGAQTNTSLNKGGSGSFISRKMSSGANQLNYNLYKEASHTTVWGDGTGGTGIFTDNIAIGLLLFNVDHPIYGRIPAGQYVPAGSYTDTITVTVEFHEGL